MKMSAATPASLSLQQDITIKKYCVPELSSKSLCPIPLPRADGREQNRSSRLLVS